MIAQSQIFSPKNIKDKNNISTPKFEGFNYLNTKNKVFENSENDPSYNSKSDNKSIKERIIYSEKKKEKNNYIKYKISNSTDNKVYFSSIFHNDQKLKKELVNSKNQISFDQKSDNYLFTNEKNNNKLPNSNSNKILYNIKKMNLLILNNDKIENDESFNYDLPLEMDKSSEIFNFTLPQEKPTPNLENTKFKEYNYNNNISINPNNKNKNISKITINIKKTNKHSDDNKIKVNEASKIYFSFDGGNQTSEDNNKIDKNIENIDNSKINTITKNDFHILQMEDNNNIDSHKKNLMSNKSEHIETNILNISHKQVNLAEDKKEISNDINNDSIKNIIYTPKKEDKKDKILQSEDNIPSKGYSIQKEKKLINKNLIGYLAFNFNSSNSKSSIDDSFSYRNNRDNSRLSDINPSKALFFDNTNESIEKLNKKDIKDYRSKKIKKSSIEHKNASSENQKSDSKEISINLQFNNYLNRSRNLYNNNNKNSFISNEKIFNFFIKNKTLPNKTSNSSQNSLNSFNSFIDLKNINSHNAFKIKNKGTIKFFPKHEKNTSSLNFFKNNSLTSNNSLKSRNNLIEYSNTSDDKNLYYTININDNKSNRILIDKRNNTLKTIHYPKALKIIKVNKAINKNSNNSLKQVMNKADNNLKNNLYSKLPFANSSKMLKIKNRTLYSLNIETKDKINGQHFFHKTIKISHTNNLKNKIESFKRINQNKQQILTSKENLNSFNKNESKKGVFNKKKIINKNKISLDENLKKKMNLNKSKKIKNIKKDKNSINFNKRNLKESNYLQFSTSQNDKLFELKKQLTINREKINNYINNNNHLLMINKNTNNKNKIKNMNIHKDCPIKNINKNNQINKKILIKQKANKFNPIDIKPSFNMMSKEIIKYSILRNNQNNKVSSVISITLGEKKNKLDNNKNNQKSNINWNNLKNDNFKKTIINVNQYYPNYYISANNK